PALARRLARRLGEAAGCPVTVGAAGPGSGPAGVAGLHRDALRCCEALLALERTGEGAGADDLGVYGLLLHEAGREDLARFVQRVVGPVLAHDAERGSDLARTLLAYYDAGGNLARTAGALYVHVNTLYQRLERIGSLLGDGWRCGDRALQVHLALRVHAVLGAGT
ncbi:PucR family transcriptional regulator, partial [Kineococcus glutinatus]|uniref:PucR family transcriptional regulator n=1 Tax=Kineococcus glutinatus TaxID=1070872 RepID=UPI0031EBF21E